MSRFFSQATEAGVIRPRSGALPDRPRGRASLARLLGGAGMVALAGLLLWLLTDDTFRVTEADVTFEGLRYADEAAVREHLAGLDRSPNVFRVRASEIVADLRDLPEVESASATVSLPATVTIRVEEREPAFAWSDGESIWLVDRTGMLFGPATLQGDTGPPDLRVVEDGRLVAEPPALGDHLPALDLAVMRQLLALTPELLGSRGEDLQLRVDQLDGYVLQSDRGWQAVFGHYTPSLRPPEVLPRQVQCLRWLLASEERQLERVRLTGSATGCGTFTKFGRRG